MSTTETTAPAPAQAPPPAAINLRVDPELRAALDAAHARRASTMGGAPISYTIRALLWAAIRAENGGAR